MKQEIAHFLSKMYLNEHSEALNKNLKLPNGSIPLNMYHWATETDYRQKNLVLYSVLGSVHQRVKQLTNSDLYSCNGASVPRQTKTFIIHTATDLC